MLRWTASFEDLYSAALDAQKDIENPPLMYGGLPCERTSSSMTRMGGSFRWRERLIQGFSSQGHDVVPGGAASKRLRLRRQNDNVQHDTRDQIRKNCGSFPLVLQPDTRPMVCFASSARRFACLAAKRSENRGYSQFNGNVATSTAKPGPGKQAS